MANGVNGLRRNYTTVGLKRWSCQAQQLARTHLELRRALLC